MALKHVSLLALSLAAIVAVDSLQAQTEEHLTTPDATHSEGLAFVQTVRELRDGRVMVADPLGEVLIIADLKAETADTLGSVGQGPEEYRQPDAVFAMPGDATLLVDLGNGRLTMVGPDGSFGETMPIIQGIPGSGGGFLAILPRGTDSEGRLYFRTGLMSGVRDSTAVVRYDRASGALDTIAQVKLPDRRQSRPVPLSAEDAWAVGWDGRVAVARSSDYHLEWIYPDGRVVSGSPVDYEPVEIKQADREEWAEGELNRIFTSAVVERESRQVTFSLNRGGGGDTPDLDSFEWPEAKPAFVANGVLVTPEGDAWVQRSVPAGERIHFDVFGADAELKGIVTIPPGSEIVGFGAGTVYVVSTDDLGLQWLQRYKRSTT